MTWGCDIILRDSEDAKIFLIVNAYQLPSFVKEFIDVCLNNWTYDRDTLVHIKTHGHYGYGATFHNCLIEVTPIAFTRVRPLMASESESVAS
jgi:hypothetical protein